MVEKCAGGSNPSDSTMVEDDPTVSIRTVSVVQPVPQQIAAVQTASHGGQRLQ